MSTLFHARSVDPGTVTEADIVAICAEFEIDTTTVPDDFFQVGQTYRRYGDTFRCTAVGIRNNAPVGIGYLPINLGGVATWEFGAMTGYDWRRGWTKVEN